MTAPTGPVRLRELFRRAPRSLDDLMALLRDGLNWPFPEDLAWDDVELEWSPEELNLNPDRVARLTRISQVPPLTGNQRAGVFVLQFDGGALPVGALRRVVDKLVVTKRAQHRGSNPMWELDDLVFFAATGSDIKVLHIVGFRHEGTKRVLRVLRWDEQPTEGRLDVLTRRAAPELTWVSTGPRLAFDEHVATHARQGVRDARALASRMAEVARDVRDEIRGLYEVETADGPIRKLFESVRDHLLGDLTPAGFADVYAQTMVYGLLTARIAHPERFESQRGVIAMEFDNAFLDAIYSRFRTHGDDVIDIDELGLADLADMLARTDVDELLADFGAASQRDDPVVYFYEEFLTRYDPSQRLALGAFYTPRPVVRYIVKQVDDALKSMGLAGGVADQTTWREFVVANPDIAIPEGLSEGTPVVSMLDPATGTGTFVVEWLEQAKRNAGIDGLIAALDHAAAIEISLASYAVGHLKVSLDLPEGLRHARRLPIYLGDTLGAKRPEVFDELADPVSTEGTLADQVKFDRHHNVIIGNPPYDRDASARAGFVTARGNGGRSLFDDILDDAKEHVVFSHTKSLNDLYVYFWRWTLWKAMEENTGPGVVSLITNSNWLTGKGFLGLRRVARELADEIMVLDLGGAGRGARTEENVFDIQTPVAIVTLIRRGSIDRTTAATSRYRRVLGSRQEKFAQIEAITSVSAWADGSVKLSDEWFAPLVPPTGASGFQTFAAVTDLLPWQQPGCSWGRTFTVAPSRGTLERRWQEFVSTDDAGYRARCYAAAASGRNIRSRVGGRRPLAEEPINAPGDPIVRYSFRSFDRQWAFSDARFATLERPSLWASASDAQIFMTAMLTNKLGVGPAATVSAFVPDFHHFAGRGGKDVVPLYRDAEGTPNADPALLTALAALHRETDDSAGEVTVERLFAYVFGVLAGTDYTARFHEELDTPGPRIPVTADPALFSAMVEHGEQLLWLQTFGERFANGRGTLPTSGIAWKPRPGRLPESQRENVYDPATQTLRVADGVLSGVRPDVWAFEVSGMEVIKKWLGYRLATAAGRARSSSSPLDQIRPTTWQPEWSDELVEIVAVLTKTLDLLPRGVGLLDEIVGGQLISASDLPEPPAALRQPPAVDRRTNQGTLGF